MAGDIDVAPSTRAPLTTERVLRAAVAFADEHGLESLSMRKLARELGFEVMSLYNHVANKDEMLDGMVDLVVEEMELPTASADWKASMRASAISGHQVLLRHPWASALWSTRMPGPARVRFMERLLAALDEAGFDPELTYHAYHALTMHIVGFTGHQLSYAFETQGELEDLARQFLGANPADEFPHLHEHVRQHFEEAHDDEFEFVLDLILDGLERSR